MIARTTPTARMATPMSRCLRASIGSVLECLDFSTLFECYLSYFYFFHLSSCFTPCNSLDSYIQLECLKQTATFVFLFRDDLVTKECRLSTVLEEAIIGPSSV